MEHWVEIPPNPSELILSWRAPEQVEDRIRWAVGALSVQGPTPSFRYFEGDEFRHLNLGRDPSQLAALGYGGYPAFETRRSTDGLFIKNALEAFLRRLPPASRTDFQSYLELFRYKGDGRSPMSLLALTQARLPSDGFSLIDPLDPQSQGCDIVVEIVGFRHQAVEHDELSIGIALELVAEPANPVDPHAVMIRAANVKIGYANRLQAKTIGAWLQTRAVTCWLVRKNGRLQSPTAYALLRMRSREESLAA